MITIVVLNEADAKMYREIRLNALKINPEAFGSTYEREAAFPIATFEERLKSTENQFVLGALKDDGSLIGIVAFKREESLKMNHKGNVFAMYVAPEHRGQGVGKLLMLELISKAKNCDGLEQINLTVVSDNDSTKQLYTSLGFETYGVERNALKFNEQYFDEDLMVLNTII
ncbi:GNAT family N-acetyltransferase [Lysinibacillus louembei]|uniref:GNAT family N-acetyltransferase n=1 Tax=Lysinibacillus louembei TaxID=1470088 RepID=A0ABZ0RUB8_9BACI|nr:GNAT family N-acetyltransferase [Lysinibacillus louembei]WPK10428.1 GNAT family N-acetyltransferase [Lysinibacillus louembei]